jgi:hypothetical protein
MNNSPHAARLRAAEQSFNKKTVGLPDRVLRLRLTALASKSPGFGEGQIDPFEKALAEQALAALKLKERVEAAASEHDELSKISDDVRVPGNPTYQQDRVMRMRELEKQAAADREKFDMVTKSSHESAQRRAIEMYEADDAQAEKLEGIREAAQTKAAELALEKSGTVDALAALYASRGGR